MFATLRYSALELLATQQWVTRNYIERMGGKYSSVGGGEYALNHHLPPLKSLKLTKLHHGIATERCVSKYKENTSYKSLKYLVASGKQDWVKGKMGFFLWLQP